MIWIWTPNWRHFKSQSVSPGENHSSLSLSWYFLFCQRWMKSVFNISLTFTLCCCNWRINCLYSINPGFQLCVLHLASPRSSLLSGIYNFSFCDKLTKSRQLSKNTRWWWQTSELQAVSLMRHRKQLLPPTADPQNLITAHTWTEGLMIINRQRAGSSLEESIVVIKFYSEKCSL